MGCSARKLKRAQILLAEDEGNQTLEIARNIGISESTVLRTVFVVAHQPWRHVKVTDSRNFLDFADCMKDLVDVHYAGHDKVRVLKSQCLDRRIGDRNCLVSEIAAREHWRNLGKEKITWRFTKEKVREKMKNAYPRIQTQDDALKKSP